MREYIVQVYDPTVWEAGLWDQITLTDGGQYIPHRPVEVVNDRPFNDYLAHFNLTDAEAELLKKDPRVKSVELQADLQPGVEKGFNSVRPAYHYDKTNTIADNMKNWGLLRASSATNPFENANSQVANFAYNLDGTGVDIVLVDTGVEPNHPEFAVNADGTGGSRVVDFDWHSLGVTGCPTSAQVNGFLGDGDGHGSNCASIAAGNTCGWATGARIYSIRIFNGTSISNSGKSLIAINSDIAYDLVKAFHLKKIADGNPRPTICSNSWGYRTTYYAMQSTHYRGTVYTDNFPNWQIGQVYNYHGVVIDYLHQSVNNCAAAGVIMVGAAGNYRHKIDVPGGADYNNYWTNSSGQPHWYHRGASPTSASGMITVGAIDNSVTEQKAYFSESGPRVDVYSPGVMIMGAYANNTYATPAVPDPRNTQYYLNKISGTSQATPQVAGYLACVAQARPSMNVEDARKFLAKHSLKNVLNENTAGGNSYGNQQSLQGGENKILYQPFKDSVRGTITS